MEHSPIRLPWLFRIRGCMNPTKAANSLPNSTGGWSLADLSSFKSGGGAVGRLFEYAGDSCRIDVVDFSCDAERVMLSRLAGARSAGGLQRSRANSWRLYDVAVYENYWKGRRVAVLPNTDGDPDWIVTVGWRAVFRSTWIRGCACVLRASLIELMWTTYTADAYDKWIGETVNYICKSGCRLP